MSEPESFNDAMRNEPFMRRLKKLADAPPSSGHKCRLCNKKTADLNLPGLYCRECAAEDERRKNLAAAVMQLPEIYRCASFGRIENRGNILKIRRALLGAMEKRLSVYLYGDVGSGKTLLMAATFLELARRGVKVKWTSMYDALGEMRSAMHDGLNPDEILFDLYLAARKGALFIDDLGAERVTDWCEDRVYGLINQLVANEGWLFVNSNFSFGEMAQRLGERTTSRLVGHCRKIKNSADDYRLVIAKRRQREWEESAKDA